MIPSYLMQLSCNSGYPRQIITEAQNCPYLAVFSVIDTMAAKTQKSPADLEFGTILTGLDTKKPLKRGALIVEGVF